MTRKVSYYYDNDVGTYAYSLHHPMKPHRIKMAHNLIVNYGLDKQLDIIRPARATPHKMTSFHTDEYIDFLSRVTPETVEELTGRETRYLIGTDCPAFEGLWEFCAISAGGSIAGAQRLNSGLSDIAVNWAGGLHHAKKREASGFCYVNDIVLAILEFLRVHARVLYIDIDVHHGDGVEEAFYTTDRVMTCSFHKFGDFFPGTGDLHDRGIGKGKGYSVNVPLRDGIDDESYRGVFRPVIQAIMDWYQPGAVILQCGADSLAEDKLGSFNLSMKGHADCITFVKAFNIPLMVLGGGGYTIRNVARTWAYETGVLAGVDLHETSPHLPFNEYMEYFGPEFKLDVPNNNMDNQNSREYLDGIRSSVIDGLRHLPFAPSVGMQSVPPPLPEVEYDSDEDLDTRISQRTRDAHTQRYGDDLSSDDETEPTTSYSSFGRKRTQPVQADELATHPSGRRRRRPRGASPPPNVMDVDEEEPVSNERPKRTFFHPSPISPFEGATLNSEMAAMKRTVPVE